MKTERWNTFAGSYWSWWRLQLMSRLYKLLIRVVNKESFKSFCLLKKTEENPRLSNIRDPRGSYRDSFSIFWFNKSSDFPQKTPLMKPQVKHKIYITELTTIYILWNWINKNWKLTDSPTGAKAMRCSEMFWESSVYFATILNLIFNVLDRCALNNSRLAIEGAGESE